MGVEMAGTEIGDIEQRFARLPSEADSIGESVIGKLKALAHEINQMVQSTSPAFLSIIQRLEQAAHVASTAPALMEKVQQDVTTDPTQAAPAASPEEVATSTPANSAPNSNDSAPASSNA